MRDNNNNKGLCAVHAIHVTGRRNSPVHSFATFHHSCITTSVVMGFSSYPPSDRRARPKRIPEPAEDGSLMLTTKRDTLRKTAAVETSPIAQHGYALHYNPFLSFLLSFQQLRSGKNRLRLGFAGFGTQIHKRESYCEMKSRGMKISI